MIILAIGDVLNITYLKKWTEEFTLCNYSFKSISVFEDIFMLSLKEFQTNIYICLNSKDNFIFYLNQKKNNFDNYCLNNIDFTVNNDLKNFNFHLNHTLIKNCSILNNDKIIEIHFSKWNIYNQQEDFYLIIELIPKYQNIILTKFDNNQKVIIECLKKITFAENHTRQILPGSIYTLPETNYIQNEELISYPLVFDNLKFNYVNDYFSTYFEKIVFEIKKKSFKSIIIRDIDKELAKAYKKKSKQMDELSLANEVDYWFQCVELLKSSFSEIESGMKSIKLTNYFIEGFPVINITLNEQLNPQKNLDSYVKRYKKALNGKKIIQENIQKTESEINNILKSKNLLQDLNDYMEIKSFKKNKDKKDKYSPKKMFRVLSISQDWEILIGRSSKENDLLTCKTAKPDDWWFHTRVYQGTHVVLRNYKKLAPPEDLVILCCRIAAYYSKAKNSLNVPVDYTNIRYVRKPKGSPAGYVVYKNQKTFYADPIDFRDAQKYINQKYIKT